MTRKLLMTTTTLIALAAAPMAYAETPQASTGTGSEVASEGAFKYDTNSPRISNGMAEFDDTSIAMSQATFRALSNARGNDLETSDGVKIGTVTGLDFNAQGNPELMVDLAADTKIAAEVLVITVQPENLMIKDGQIYLATSLDELYLKAQSGNARDSAGRTAITLM